MGHISNAISNRLGYSVPWTNGWVTESNYKTYFHKDYLLRNFINTLFQKYTVNPYIRPALRDDAYDSSAIENPFTTNSFTFSHSRISRSQNLTLGCYFLDVFLENWVKNINKYGAKKSSNRFLPKLNNKRQAHRLASYKRRSKLNYWFNKRVLKKWKLIRKLAYIKSYKKRSFKKFSWENVGGLTKKLNVLNKLNIILQKKPINKSISEVFDTETIKYFKTKLQYSRFKQDKRYTILQKSRRRYRYRYRKIQSVSFYENQEKIKNQRLNALNNTLSSSMQVKLFIEQYFKTYYSLANSRKYKHQFILKIQLYKDMPKFKKRRFKFILRNSSKLSKYWFWLLFKKNFNKIYNISKTNKLIKTLDCYNNYKESYLNHRHFVFKFKHAEKN